jgi:hypothetical protein
MEETNPIITKKFEELFFRRITDVREFHSVYNDEISMCDSYIMLDNGWIFDMPNEFSDGEISLTALDEKASSIFAGLPTIKGESNWKNVQHWVITDVLIPEEGYDTVIIEIDNSSYLYKIPAIMYGAGPAGIRCYSSLHDIIKRFGFNYTRVSGRVDE